MIYLVLLLIVVGLGLLGYKYRDVIKARIGLTAPAVVPNAAPAPTVVNTPAPQTVTLPNTNQQVSSVTDAFLRSGAGYGRTDTAPAPAGVRDTSPNWTAFDGHGCRVTSEPGKPMTFEVNVGKPFVLSVSEAGTGTAPGGQMTVTASTLSGQVATITKPFAQAVDLPVPVGAATVTAVYDRVSTFDVTVRQG